MTTGVARTLDVMISGGACNKKSSENLLIFRAHHNLASQFGTPSGIRTLDPLIKSQLLYQLS